MKYIAMLNIRRLPTLTQQEREGLIIFLQAQLKKFKKEKDFSIYTDNYNAILNK